MFNLIKMDMYRLIHSTTTWITLMVIVLTALFGIAMTNLDIEESKEQPPVGFMIEKKADEELESVQAGIYVEGNSEWANGKIELGDLIAMELQSGMTATICAIFVALFTNADYRNGYIKNIAGQFPNRKCFVFSKFIAIAVQTLLLVTIFSISIGIFGYILWADKLYILSWTSISKIFCVQYVLHLGLAALVMLFTTFVRSTAFGMSAGILICSGATVFLYAGVNEIISKINPNLDFDINNYMLSSNMRLIDLNSNSDILIRGAAVGITFVIIALICTMITVNKRDIK